MWINVDINLGKLIVVILDLSIVLLNRVLVTNALHALPVVLLNDGLILGDDAAKQTEQTTFLDDRGSHETVTQVILALTGHVLQHVSLLHIVAPCTLQAIKSEKLEVVFVHVQEFGVNRVSARLRLGEGRFSKALPVLLVNIL